MILQIGIIGYRNHALRLIQLVSQNEYSEVKVVYHPYKKLDLPCATNRIQDLYQCDAIVISSPNQSHFGYIVRFLKHYKGYIFCEKPPVNSLADLQRLSNIPCSDKNRVYFNYNYRFELLNSILNDSIYLKKLGSILHIEILSAHGLAFKKEYINSWRADGENNLHAITETVAIHFIDILGLKFGQFNNYVYNPSIIANTGNAYDTVHIALNFDKVTASIFASYACPVIDDISIIGTEGLLRISDGQLNFYYPRDTFDENGFFKAPPLIQKSKIDMQYEYQKSLRNSFEFFIDHAHKKKKIDLKYFDASISSNRFLLEIQKK